MFNFKIKADSNFKNAYQQLASDKNNVVSNMVEDVPFNRDGILAGVTFTAKDLYAVKGYPTQASTKTLDGFMPHYTATAIKKLVDEGARLVAKVHLDELGMGGTGLNWSYGNVYHPKNKDYIIGGSSSGSVASMYYDVAFSLGSDTGDSVRNPAGWNGFVGFKPSWGAISRYGMFPYASSLDTVAYFTHNVNDSFVLSKILFGKDEKDMTTRDTDLGSFSQEKPKKILMIKNTEGFSSQVQHEYKKLIKKFEKLQNIEVDVVEFDEDLLNHVKNVYDVISYSEATSNLASLKGLQFGKKSAGKDWEEITLRHRSDNFGRMVQKRLTLGSVFLSNEHIDEIFYGAQKMRKKITDYINSLLSNYDIWVYPAAWGRAPKVTEKFEPNFAHWILTNSNLTGNPSIVIPWFEMDDMPVGIAVDANFGKDGDLLRHTFWLTKIVGDKDE